MPVNAKKPEPGSDKTGAARSKKRLPKTSPQRPDGVKQVKWQDRLLPVMIGLLVGLTLFFFASTFWQMSYLYRSILEMPAVDIQDQSGVALADHAETFEDRLNARSLEVKSQMEAYIVTQRYHQASVLLMANLWIRYLGFATGMILALVGASFVLGKLREPAQKLEGKFSVADISMRTTSPGIILVVLGVVLMFTTLVDEDYYKVTDGNIYLAAPVALPAIQDTAVDTFMPDSPFFGTETPQPENPVP